jgi:hypothetical protein
MMDILSENSKKEYPKSVTELLSLEEKRFLQEDQDVGGWTILKWILER